MTRFRWYSAIGLFITLLLLGFAFYLQFVLKIEPCALCIMQRLWLFVLIALFFIALLHNPHRIGQRIYSALEFCAAIIGGGFALRQIYLQLQPPDPNAVCLPGISYLFAQLPLTDVLHALVTGTGECAVVSWEFLGLSTPVWTLLFFGFFALLAILQGIKATDRISL